MLIKLQRFYRRDQLCGRCLRGMDTRAHDELSIMLDQEEYDDISVAESLIGESQREPEPVTQVFSFLVTYIRFSCKLISIKTRLLSLS